MQMMPTNPALDFLPHSRSNSVSSSSSLSRPHSSQGSPFLRLPPDDLYRTPPYPHNLMHPDSIQSHSALKGPLRPSHIRARVAASPYPRDTDSLSSSSETEDISLYLSAQTPGEYPPQLFSSGPAPSQEAIHATGALGRMSLSPDHALEKLAANVRAATTTSASDRAKQIFVQSWYVTSFFRNAPCSRLTFSPPGLPLIMLHIPMEMYHVRASISLIAGCATSMVFPTLILPPWARPFASVSQLSRLAGWASEGTANITVCRPIVFLSS